MRGSLYGLILGVILTVCLIMTQAKGLQLIYSKFKLDNSNILKYTERAQRVSQACAYEGLSVLFYKVSIRPNKDMNRQGTNLQKLTFEERDEATILRQ